MKLDAEIVSEVFNAYRASDGTSHPDEDAFVRAGRLVEVQEIIEWMESVTIDERLLLIMRDRLVELEKS